MTTTIVGIVCGLLGLAAGVWLTTMAVLNDPRRLAELLTQLADSEDDAKAHGGRKNWRGKWVL